MPLYKILILLSPNADLNSMSVTIDNAVTQEMNGTFNVAPVQIPKNYQVPKEQTIIDGKNAAVFEKNDFYPASFIGKTSFDYMRQYKIATIDIYPYRYNPVSRKLLKITDGTLTISSSGKSSAGYILFQMV